MRLLLKWIGAVANVAAVIGASTDWIPLPSAIEPYRNAIIVVCSLLAVAFLYLALGGRVTFRPTQTGRPVIAIIGLDEAETLAAEINKQPELKINEHIAFKSVKAEKSGFTPAGTKVLDTAAGNILTSDFNANTSPKGYERFKDSRRRHPVPVRRSYPQGFDRPLYGDFQRISHDTPSGIVNYFAEYVLVDFVGLVHLHVKRSRRAMLYSCVVTVILAIGVDGINSHFDAISSPPNIVTRERGAAVRFVECVAKADTRMNRAHCTGEYLDDIGNVIDDALRVVLDDHNDNEVMLFVRSRTPGVLRGLALGTDMTPYDVSATGSIAGCSLDNNLGVTWSGHDGITEAISGRQINGDRVGTYDVDQKQLLLSTGKVCTFQAVLATDQKRSLHCLPVGSDMSKGEPAKAAFCISRAAKDNVLSRPEVQNYVADLSNALAFADLSVLETSKPFEPTVGKAPAAKSNTRSVPASPN